LAIFNHARASELPWKNLQTRNLQYSYNLKKQSWKPPQELPNPLFRVTKRKNEHSTYSGPPNFPFEVLLLHDLKKKTKYQYHNSLSLYGILESFNSVFDYVGEPLINQRFSTPVQTLPPLVNNLPLLNYGQSSDGVITNDQFDIL